VIPRAEVDGRVDAPGIDLLRRVVREDLDVGRAQRSDGRPSRARQSEDEDASRKIAHEASVMRGPPVKAGAPRADACTRPSGSR
jgi:hypothetical protein